jgi:hypothetical protein
LKTSPEIQKLIEELFTEHAIDLYPVGAYLKLNIGKENKYIPLVIERVAPMVISVAHRYENSDGEIVNNPQVSFFTGYEEWVAVDILQPTSTALTLDRFGGYHQFAQLTNDGLAIYRYDTQEQANLAVFVKNWYKVLKETNWLGRASNTAYIQTSFADGIVDGDVSPIEPESNIVPFGDYRSLPAGDDFKSLPDPDYALASGK